MTEEEIVQKFILAGKIPTKYSVQDVLGFSAQTLVRRGFVMSEIKKLYLKLTQVEKLCLFCNSAVCNRNNIYCSQSCSAKANNPRRRREAVSKTVDIDVSHATVSKPLTNKQCICCTTTLSSNQAKYCSYSCQQKYQYESFIKLWLSGEDMKFSEGSAVSDRIRRYLFEKYSCKCSRCGWGEINPRTGKVPLEVEHIDGNSENNSPDNLTLLCPNCHSLTPTYRALNKGNGRHSRRQRYKDGKSY